MAGLVLIILLEDLLNVLLESLVVSVVPSSGVIDLLVPLHLLVGISLLAPCIETALLSAETLLSWLTPSTLLSLLSWLTPSSLLSLLSWLTPSSLLSLLAPLALLALLSPLSLLPSLLTRLSPSWLLSGISPSLLSLTLESLVACIRPLLPPYMAYLNN